MTSAATPRDDDPDPKPSLWNETRDEQADEALTSAVSSPLDGRTGAVIQRRYEAELFAELLATDFTGPVWDYIAEETAAYMVDVLTGWLCTRQLGAQLARKGIPFLPTVTEVEELATNEAHRQSIVDYACLVALKSFPAKARNGEGWRPNMPASFETWMITAALYQIINQLKEWRNVAARYRDAVVISKAQAKSLLRSDLRGDLTSNTNFVDDIANREVLQQFLRDLPGTHDRNIVMGRAYKYTYGEIAQLDGALDSRAVERRWNWLKANYDWIARLDEKA